MKSLGNLLQNKSHGSSVLKSVASAMVVEDVKGVLKQYIGPKVEKYAKPMYIKNGILTIACLSSVIAQEIKLNESYIINSLNKKIGKDIIKKIRYLA